MKQENNRTIEQQVEASLKLLNSNKEIEPNPFFYTRLMAQINSAKTPVGFGQFKAAYLVPALLAVLLILNILTYFFAGTGSNVTNTATDQQKTNIYVLPGDYSYPMN